MKMNKDRYSLSYSRQSTEPHGLTGREAIPRLLSMHIRNPTFAPDVADLYVFRLETTDASGAKSIRTLAFNATPTLLLSPQVNLSGKNNVQFSFTVQWETSGKVEIQSSTNLTDWRTLKTLTNVNGSLRFTDNISSRGQSFYRTRQSGSNSCKSCETRACVWKSDPGGCIGRGSRRVGVVIN